MKDALPGIRHGSATDIGLVRDIQQDAYLVRPPLFAVADGMGGHSAGDVASKLALQVMSEEELEDEESLRVAVRRANDAIFAKAASDPSLSGMGTTITAMLARPGSARIAHVGDSRAYLLRDGDFQAITEDHTVVGRMVRQGRLTAEEAARHPQRSVLERALGVGEELVVDVFERRVLPGDRVLLCTDGLTALVDDQTITEVLSSESNPETAATSLVRLAVNAGGLDNVTAIVIDYPDDGGSPRKRKRRLWIPAGIGGVLAGTIVAVITALAGSWFVGIDDQRVAVFRGVPGSFAGVDLHRVAFVSEIPVTQLSDFNRNRLRDGIRANGEAEARRIVENLTELQEDNAGRTAP